MNSKVTGKWYQEKAFQLEMAVLDLQISKMPKYKGLWKTLLEQGTMIITWPQNVPRETT